MGISDVGDENCASFQQHSWLNEDGEPMEPQPQQYQGQNETAGSTGTAGMGHARVSPSKERHLMESYNEVCDELTFLKRDGNMNEVDVPLPLIVVVGAQSSGKTSLLETIAKIDFLPKGSDIQTRCPIEIQLTRSTNGRTWVEFLEQPGKIFTSMTLVKREIEMVNEKIKQEKVPQVDSDGVTREKDVVVSDIPITLKLFSPHVPNLTLVDLPGFCPSPNDKQPKDLKNKIEQVVKKYISNPNAIILAVVPASQELETNTTPEFVEEADQYRERTVLVITKLDTAVKCNTIPNVVKTLEGKNKAYRLGIFGVVNRLPSISPEKADEYEKTVLQTDFPTIANKNGIPYFVSEISRLLINKISDSLPVVKSIIAGKIRQLKERIMELGVEDANKKFYKYVNEFSETYRSQIHGEKKNLIHSGFPLSTKAHDIIEKIFFPEIDNFKFCEDITDDDLAHSLGSSKGIQGHERLTGHSKKSANTTDTFHCYITREIEKLKPILMNCAEKVNTEMKAAIATSHNEKVVMHYNALVERINKVVTQLIRESFEECEKYLLLYIECESCVAFTLEPDFYEKNGKQKSKGLLGKPKTQPILEDDWEESIADQSESQDAPKSLKISYATKLKNRKGKGGQRSEGRKIAIDMMENSVKKRVKKGKKVREPSPQGKTEGGAKHVVGSITNAVSEGLGKIPGVGGIAAVGVHLLGEGIKSLIPDAEDDTSQHQPNVGNPTKKNRTIYDEMRREMQFYLADVKVSVKKHVPKGIFKTLVYGVGKRLEDELTDRMLDGDVDTKELIRQLMRLSEKVETERENAEKALQRYQKAGEILERTIASPRVY